MKDQMSLMSNEDIRIIQRIIKDTVEDVNEMFNNESKSPAYILGYLMGSMNEVQNFLEWHIKEENNQTTNDQ